MVVPIYSIGYLIILSCRAHFLKPPIRRTFRWKSRIFLEIILSLDAQEKLIGSRSKVRKPFDAEFQNKQLRPRVTDVRVVQNPNAVRFLKIPAARKKWTFSCEVNWIIKLTTVLFKYFNWWIVEYHRIWINYLMKSSSRKVTCSISILPI